MEALLEAALRLTAPLLIAALGELIVQRSGTVNIGIEGTMLTGAFAGFAVAVASGSAWLGVGGAALAGCGVGMLFAHLAVRRGIDQIVVGMAVNLLALGGTGLAARALYAGAPPVAPPLQPWLGHPPFVGLGLLLAVAAGLGLALTRPGLRLPRSASRRGPQTPRGWTWRAPARRRSWSARPSRESPAPALSLALSDTFTEGMTAGRGFIALAIVIFGRWVCGRGHAGGALLRSGDGAAVPAAGPRRERSVPGLPDAPLRP